MQLVLRGKIWKSALLLTTHLNKEDAVFSIALKRGKCMKKVCKMYFMCTCKNYDSDSNTTSLFLLQFVFNIEPDYRMAFFVAF